MRINGTMSITERIRLKLANLLLRALRRLTRSQFGRSRAGEDPRDTVKGRYGVHRQMEFAVWGFQILSYQCGCAAFEQFASLMIEFVKACGDAEVAGEPEWALHGRQGSYVRIPVLGRTAKVSQ